MKNPNISFFIKTECGRAKYSELASRKGLTAKIRLYWFICFAALKDWNLSNPDQVEESNP